MKKILILTTALTGFAFSASAQELTVMSWGAPMAKPRPRRM